jgi:predicted DNA-binding transcriptional regulator AlpA
MKSSTYRSRWTGTTQSIAYPSPKTGAIPSPALATNSPRVALAWTGQITAPSPHARRRSDGRSPAHIVRRMMKLARREHRRKPSLSGLYAISLVTDGEGNIPCDKQGAPVVVIPPMGVAGLSEDERSVFFYHTEQLVAPKNVAALADVHVATVHRAVKDGDLPKPIQISPRRVGHRLLDVHQWLSSRKSS